VDTTFDQYINNPAGMKNSVISHREMYRAMYSQKLDAIYLREKGEIDYIVYKHKDDYIIHMKIPSEAVENFYYDVVIQFSPPNTAGSLVSNISGYNVHFYSNDPSFVYTFAHAFNKHGLLIKDLIPKMSKLAIKERAKERNPDDQIGYVKSLYFAYLIMVNKNLFSKIRLDSMSVPYDKKKLLADVMDADEKVELRKEGATPKKKKKQDSTQQEKPQQSGETHITGGSPLSKAIKKTKRTASSLKTSRVKRSKRT
jgi:hypothetical protein